MNSSLLGLEFFSGFYPRFSFLQNAIFRYRLEYSRFADFFVRILKTRQKYGFL
jgi:hypothetical protein